MEHLLATWGYLALFAVTFLSAMGIPIGSEPAMGYAGALASGALTAAGHTHLQLGFVILVAAAGDTVGSVAGYSIGRFGGRPLVDRVGKYILLTHRDLDRAEDWFARRGDPFVFFGRFIPLLRSFVSLAAGLGEMTMGKFLVFTVFGTLLYDAAISSIGYALGSSWNHVIHDFSDAGYAVAVLIVLAVVAVFVQRIRVVRQEQAGGPTSRSPGRHVRGSAPGSRLIATSLSSTPAAPGGPGSGGSYPGIPEPVGADGVAPETAAGAAGPGAGGPARSHVRIQETARPRALPGTVDDPG